VGLELELGLVEGPHVGQVLELCQVAGQVQQLLVLLALVVGDDRDAVVHLEVVGVHCVVDQHHAAQRPLYHSQVLDVQAHLGLEAVLPVEPVRDHLASGVQVVDHLIRVAAVAGREDDNLELFVQLLEHLLRVRPDIYPGADHVASRECDRQDAVTIAVDLVAAVDEGLIEIEDQGLALGVLWVFGQGQLPGPHLLV
jgi:hypothetical protein